MHMLMLQAYKQVFDYMIKRVFAALRLIYVPFSSVYHLSVPTIIDLTTHTFMHLLGWYDC